ncbi:hypothetical protein D6745_00330 [Candidatus Woesearchaeota archaeon]|nr:MAG: hypothetical protein D6745_00330 [Candidatus Woesearchaeota archaeon]
MKKAVVLIISLFAIISVHAAETENANSLIETCASTGGITNEEKLSEENGIASIKVECRCPPGYWWSYTLGCVKGERILLCENLEVGSGSSHNCASNIKDVKRLLSKEDFNSVSVEGSYADPEDKLWDGLFFYAGKLPENPTLEIYVSPSPNAKIKPSMLYVIGDLNTGEFTHKIKDVVVDKREKVSINVSEYLNSGGRAFLIMPNPAGSAFNIDKISFKGVEIKTEEKKETNNLDVLIPATLFLLACLAVIYAASHFLMRKTS